MDSEGSDLPAAAAAACPASAAAAVSAGSDDLPPVLFQTRFRRMETLPEQLATASVATVSYPFNPKTVHDYVERDAVQTYLNN